MGLILSRSNNNNNSFSLSITIDDVKASPDIVWETVTGDVYNIPNISPNVTSIEVLHNNTNSFNTDELSSYDDNNDDNTTLKRAGRTKKDHECNNDDINENVHPSDRSQNESNMNVNKHESNRTMNNNLERDYYQPPSSNNNQYQHMNTNNKKIFPMKEGLGWLEVRQFRKRIMKLHKQITLMETSSIIDDITQQQHELKTVRIHVQLVGTCKKGKKLDNQCKKRCMKKSVKTESITVDSIIQIPTNSSTTNSSNNYVVTETTNRITKHNVDQSNSSSLSLSSISPQQQQMSPQHCCRLIYTTVIVLPPHAYFISCIVRKYRLSHYLYQYYYNELKQIAVIAEEKSMMIQNEQKQNQLKDISESSSNVTTTYHAIVKT